MLRAIFMLIAGMSLSCHASDPADQSFDAGGVADGEASTPDDSSDGSSSTFDAGPQDMADMPADSEMTDASDSSQPWRSRLYPVDWRPGVYAESSARLHDFSFAGYRRGESEWVAPDGEVDVVDFGADPSGSNDSTSAFDAAIAAVSGSGGTVRVPAGTYRIDGLLEITASNVALVGDGSEATRLWFTRTDGMQHRSHVTFRGVVRTDIEVPLAVSGEPFDTVVRVEDASQLAPGDHVQIGWVITPEFVDEHGMTDTWRAFNDAWQPFFRREVVAVNTAVDPHEVVIDVPLRYAAKTRDGASIRREHGTLSECGVVGLALSNATDPDIAWSLDQVHALELRGVRDCMVRDVASWDGPNGTPHHLQSSGVMVRASKRVTIADSSMEFPQNRGPGGNGYLFELRASNEILIRDTVARAGRHNFTVNWGFGTTGCVWLRVRSSEGRAEHERDGLSTTGYADFHHSLATANLIDSSTFEDGWKAENRKQYSSGAGHTATESVFWNVGGTGRLISYQWGMGYVIGTGSELEVVTDIPEPPTEQVRQEWDALGAWEGSAPVDWREGVGHGATLQPQSLYVDQLARRLDR
jgi:hypothetical protein